MAASALIAMPLYAQEVDVTGSSPSAPASPADNAFEVTFGLGYAPGFGDIGAGQPSLTDQITVGGELQLGLGEDQSQFHDRCLRYGGGLQGTQQMTSGATIYTATAGVQGN